MEVSFILEGVTPILFHADDIDANDEVQAWRKDEKNREAFTPGDDRTPPWTWQTYLYSDGKNVAWPAQNIMVCLRQAGTQMILKKQKTYKEITQSGLLIEQEFCEFSSGGKVIEMASLAKFRDKPYRQHVEAVSKMNFRLFAKRARVGSSKHIRVRARFESWQVSGTIRILTPLITYEVLEKLFELAGRVGLGDWRPGCKTPGSFGMFQATLKRA